MVEHICIVVHWSTFRVGLMEMKPVIFLYVNTLIELEGLQHSQDWWTHQPEVWALLSTTRLYPGIRTVQCSTHLFSVPKSMLYGVYIYVSTTVSISLSRTVSKCDYDYFFIFERCTWLVEYFLFSWNYIILLFLSRSKLYNKIRTTDRNLSRFWKTAIAPT